MQRFLVSLLLVMAGTSLFAQSIDDIKEQIGKGQWDKAKTSVDAYLAKEKNAAKWDGWWYKGVIYNEIVKNDQFKNLAPDGRMEAFLAFKKYYEIEPKAIQATLEQHVRLFDIYNGYFDNGVKGFNEANFESAYTNFKNAMMVEEYIASKDLEYNGFKFPAFDTTLVQNIALSAYRAKKDDDAVVYYKKIADKKIAGKDNIDIYQLLIEYYTKRNDEPNQEKYLQLSRELYPTDDRWFQMELEEVNDKDKKALFAKYDELGLKYPDKQVLFYNYGVELYNYLYTGDTKPADYFPMQAKLEATLKKTLEINKNYVEANVLISRHFYNIIFDYQDTLNRIKGKTPNELKRKTDLQAKITAVADQMIPFASTAYGIYEAKTTLKAVDKGNFKMTADLLSSAYEAKGDKVKAEEYKKKVSAIN